MCNFSRSQVLRGYLKKIREKVMAYIIKVSEAIHSKPYMPWREADFTSFLSSRDHNNNTQNYVIS